MAQSSQFKDVSRDPSQSCSTIGLSTRVGVFTLATGVNST